MGGGGGSGGGGGGGDDERLSQVSIAALNALISARRGGEAQQHEAAIGHSSEPTAGWGRHSRRGSQRPTVCRQPLLSSQ